MFVHGFENADVLKRTIRRKGEYENYGFYQEMESSLANTFQNLMARIRQNPELLKSFTEMKGV